MRLCELDPSLGLFDTPAFPVIVTHQISPSAAANNHTRVSALLFGAPLIEARLAVLVISILGIISNSPTSALALNAIKLIVAAVRRLG